MADVKKLEKVQCPQCGKLTPRLARCMFCGTAMVRVKEEKLPDVVSEAGELSYLNRTAQCFNSLKNQSVADVTFFHYMADGSLPGLKRLRVPDHHQAVLVTGLKRELLDPGEYEVSTLGTANSIRDAAKSERTGGAMCVCLFPSRLMSVTLLLPDPWDLSATGHDVDKAVEALSLRTADNHLGTVEMNLRVRVAEPLKIASMAANKVLKAATADLKDLKDRDSRDPDGQGSVVGTTMLYPLKMLGRFFTGGKAENTRIEPQRITLHEIYETFRSELALAVRAAVRQETVEALYDTIQVRDRITEDLSRALAPTFDVFGLMLERVTAFRFQSEAYDQLLRRRGNIALEKAGLQDKRSAAEIEAEQLKIDAERRGVRVEDARQQTTVEQDLNRHLLEEAAKTESLQDQTKVDALKRRMAADAMLRGHHREQELLAEQQRMQLSITLQKQQFELERQKMLMRMEEKRMKIEMVSMGDDAALKRRLEYDNAQVANQQKLLQAGAGLTSEQILATALSQNPKLGNAFAEMQKAKMALLNHGKQLEIQEQFRGQLETAYGKNNELVGGLMNEAIKQFGAVQGKKYESERAQVVATGAGQHLLEVKRAHDQPVETAAGPSAANPEITVETPQPADGGN